MKQTMFLAIIALTAIVLVSSFGLQLSHTEIIQVPESVIGQELYVCPAANQMWDSMAAAFQPFIKFFIVGFFFVAILLLFTWGWALYQNLLKDSFKRDAFSKPWQFTKLAFWAGVILLLLCATPNYFRTVHINGVNGNWVLCENNSPDARAVRADAVTH